MREAYRSDPPGPGTNRPRPPVISRGEMPAPTEPDPDHLPTPFSAAEIRAASRPGKTMRLRHSSVGEVPFERVIRFVTVDDDGADRVTYRVAADGTLVDGV